MPPFIMASIWARVWGGMRASWSGVSCGMAGMATPEIWLVVVASIGLISWAQVAAGHRIAMASKICFTSKTLLGDNGIS